MRIVTTGAWAPGDVGFLVFRRRWGRRGEWTFEARPALGPEGPIVHGWIGWHRPAGRWNFAEARWAAGLGRVETAAAPWGDVLQVRRLRGVELQSALRTLGIEPGGEG